MKKIFSLLITLLLMPTYVSALVNDHSPLVDVYGDQATCLQQLTANNNNNNVANGNNYYLTCISFTCEGGFVKHNDLKPILNNMTCANGNQNPLTEILDTGGTGSGSPVNLGATCTTTDALEYKYATQRVRFDCGLLPTGTAYDPVGDTNTTTTTTTTNNNTNNGTTPNPETGIETYYAVLAGMIIVLSVGLYIVNQKNLFKRI